MLLHPSVLLPLAPLVFQLTKPSSKPGAWLPSAQLAFWGGIALQMQLIAT